MNATTIVTIASIVLLLIGLAVVTYFYVRDKTLDEIREEVYNLFLLAERRFTESGAGEEKMAYVIQMTLNLLPPWARFFITESMLRHVVQLWFDSIKDLLDDGKYNGSIAEDPDFEILDLDE